GLICSCTTCEFRRTIHSINRSGAIPHGTRCFHCQLGSAARRASVGGGCARLLQLLPRASAGVVGVPAPPPSHRRGCAGSFARELCPRTRLWLRRVAPAGGVEVAAVSHRQ